MVDTSKTLSLLDLAKGCSGLIAELLHARPEDAHGEMTRRLAELGFLRGEPVRVIARGLTGGEPIAVRVGTSTFALRRAEAERIRVHPFIQ